MDNKHKQKVYNEQGSKISNIILTLLLSILATMIGVQFGDLWYKLNFNLVEKVDSESFKNTINVSLPIIETIYNSGKSSVSLSGEIREIFVRTFGFDLNLPATILNVQSPVFMSYYNGQYNSENGIGGIGTAWAGTPGSDEKGDIDVTGADPKGEGLNSGDGDRQEAGNGANGQGSDESGGQGTGDGTGGGGQGDKDGEGGIQGKDGKGSDTPENGDEKSGKQGDETGGKEGKGEYSDDGQPKAQDKDQVTDPQPVSSIVYEEEDENEEDSDLVASDEILIRNFTKHPIDINELLKKPLNIEFAKKGPKVLIYHTHTSESYVLKESDLGKKDVTSFNSNPKYNVVRVGEELARNLKKYGIETLHNGTIHDKSRPAAYSLSIDTLKSYRESYPSIKVFIDLHRDAVGNEKPKLRMVKKINGKNAAQIMFVVGADGTLPHPQWKENLKFVLKLQKKLNEKYPGLARPVWIVAKRYNQQISNQSILIEVGGDGNLLSECLESTKYLAEVLDEVLLEE